MSSAAETTPPTDASRGVVRDWILPIALGLAIGAAVVGAWVYGPALLRSEADRLVRSWSAGEFEANDELDEKIRALGKEARPDLLQAFRAVQVPPGAFDREEEQKTWAARLLAGAPFFDSRSLLEIARDPDAPVWDRRCAAAALVETIGKDVDPTAVVEPLLGWVEDLETIDHSIPLRALNLLSRHRLFPPESEDRALKARMRLASKEARPVPEHVEDQMRLAADRDLALQELGEKISRDEVKAVVWEIALDESDDVRVRVAALRTLAAKEQFGDVENWRRLARSSEIVIRQTVADNLGKAEDVAFDDVLAPLHEDAGELVRVGSLDAQIVRNRATMLPIMGMLVEDASPFVRRLALLSCGRFKHHLDDVAKRKGMVLRALETSDDEEEIAGAVGAVYELTGELHGFASGDVDSEGATGHAVAAFRADVEGRRQAVEKWRAALGPGAVWTDADRRPWLERLAKHADPANRERALQELSKLDRAK